MAKRKASRRQNKQPKSQTTLSNHVKKADTPLSEPSIFPFLSLPPELRNRIYDAALLQNEGHVVVKRNLKIPKILQLSQQIRSEAYRSWYTENEFHIVVDGCDASMLEKWVKNIDTLPNDFEAKLVVSVKGACRWEGLVDWCKRIHANHSLMAFELEDGAGEMDEYETVVAVATKLAVDRRAQPVQWMVRQLEVWRVNDQLFSNWGY